MTASDVGWFIASLFGCWVLGWGTAFVITFIKQMSEKI